MGGGRVVGRAINMIVGATIFSRVHTCAAMDNINATMDMGAMMGKIIVTMDVIGRHDRRVRCRTGVIERESREDGGGRGAGEERGVGLQEVRVGEVVRDGLVAGEGAGVGDKITFDQGLILSAPEAKHGGEGVEGSRRERGLLNVPGGAVGGEGNVKDSKEEGEDSDEEEVGLPYCIA